MDKYSTRWIRELIKRYAHAAGIKKRIYPHLFRHQLLTHLAKEGIMDSKVQVISGHQDRKSLAIYQTLSLADVKKDYQEAMKNFPII
jgi:site-specific recombinase XerD